MVSKCANPECSASFLYFHRGLVFRVETEGRLDRRRDLGNEQGTSKPLRRIEFYWLCGDCARKLTLAFDKTTGVSVRPRASAESSTAAAAIAASAA